MLRLCFDVDGVILDFHSAYVREAEYHLGMTIAQTFQQPLYLDEALTDQERFQIWEGLVNSERFEALETLVDVQAFNQTFETLPVHFITNIPQLIKPRRLINLKNLGFQFESLHCAGFTKFPEDDTPPKSKMIQQLSQPEERIVFVDDYIDNCLDVINVFPDAHVMLFMTPFNQDILTQDGIERIESWEHFFQRFQEIKILNHLI